MNSEDLDHYNTQALISATRKQIKKLDAATFHKRVAIVKCKEALHEAEYANTKAKEELRTARKKLAQLEGLEKLGITQSRWGIHPCHYDHYLKLKFLHKKMWQAIYKLAEWERWGRKAPQNRVIRKTHRDENRRKIGTEIVSSRPAPPLCPVFTFKSRSTADFKYMMMRRSKAEPEPTKIPRSFEVSEDWGELGYPSYWLWLYDPGIIDDYQNARTPVTNLMEMKPLVLSAEAVDLLCAKFPDNPFAKHKPPQMHPMDIISYMVKNLPMADDLISCLPDSED